MAECGACGTAEAMLFVCRHCEGKFCAAHVREHGCGAAGGAPAGERAPADERAPAGRRARVAVGASTAEAGTAAATDTATASTVPGRDGPAGREPSAPVRSMDSRGPPGETPRHRPETVAGWLRQQTYLTLVVKVGLLALLISLVFYAGLVFALYDPIGIL